MKKVKHLKTGRIYAYMGTGCYTDIKDAFIVVKEIEGKYHFRTFPINEVEILENN